MLKMVYQCERNIIISWKKAQKVDFWKLLDPFWGFILKTVPGLHDPRISWLTFGTKYHEMRGPPVVLLTPTAIFEIVFQPMKKIAHQFYLLFCDSLWEQIY